MSTSMMSLLNGSILEDGEQLSLNELCRACQVPAEVILEMVEYGLIEPQGREPARWRFSGMSLRRVRCAQRLQQDLGVNTPGAALAVELLEEMERLRRRLARLER